MSFPINSDPQNNSVYILKGKNGEKIGQIKISGYIGNTPIQELMPKIGKGLKKEGYTVSSPEANADKVTQAYAANTPLSKL
jgi:hypothetical protein